MYSRRDFLKQTPPLISLLAGLPAFAGSSLSQKRVILLRSSWQTVNIGDIGHTPGVLRLLEEYLPNTEVRLWPVSVGHGVAEMLRRRFPKVAIIKNPEELKAAFKESDFLLHGSGPSLVARKDLKKWDETTGKPYGIYGITFPGYYGKPSEAQKASLAADIKILNKARFVFFRDSVSLRFAKDHAVTCPVMEFGPDGAFAVDVKNDNAATAFLQKHRLEEGKFLCVIPRLRYTPYWEIPEKHRALDKKRDTRNQEMKEHDNAPLREAIIAVTRKTSMKILICPEDETQVKLGKEILYDRLPDDVKPRVVWKDTYWLTDEAVSTYVRSAGLFGLEMHSPIMCVGNGIPAIVCRFYEQSSKGFMWRDIGLGEWLFDMDHEEEVEKIVPAVLAMARHPAKAKKKALHAKAFVNKRQRETMDVLKKSLV